MTTPTGIERPITIRELPSPNPQPKTLQRNLVVPRFHVNKATALHHFARELVQWHFYKLPVRNCDQKHFECCSRTIPIRVQLRSLISNAFAITEGPGIRIKYCAKFWGFG
jgi:hypothetical protein